MTSFFSPACFIFMATWLSAISVLLACFTYRLENTFFEDRLKMNLTMMTTVCTTITGIAFLGCIFVLCNIHHTCCAVLFIISCGLVSPALCIWGAVITKGDDAPSASETLKKTREYFQENKKFPQWLVTAEERLECCGVSGAFYYRELFRSLDYNNCIKYICDIPATCMVRNKDKDGELSLTSEEHIHQNLCRPKGKDKQRGEIVKVENSTNIQDKCKKRKTGESYFDFINDQYKKLVYRKGCYYLLTKNYREFCFFIFYSFICFFICSLVMVVAYGRFFCKSSTITGEKSDYSLDVEAISLLDIPTSDWPDTTGQPMRKANSKDGLVNMESEQTM